MEKKVLLAIAIIAVAAITFSIYTEKFYGKTETWKSISMKIPAIGADGKGFLMQMDVEIREGSGRIGIISEGKKIAISGGTEDSLGNAVKAAAKFTGAEFGNRDITFRMHQEGFIAGSSASAGAALGIVALFRNQHIRDDALITGSIAENGKVGRVGSILEKAQAAKAAGYKILLVPEGEAKVWVIPEGCRKDDGSSLAGCKPEKEEADVMETMGMAIIEVNDLKEAVEFMLLE